MDGTLPGKKDDRLSLRRVVIVTLGKVENNAMHMGEPWRHSHHTKGKLCTRAKNGP